MGAMKFDPEAYTMSNEEWCKRAEMDIREEKSIHEGEALMQEGNENDYPNNQ